MIKKDRLQITAGGQEQIFPPKYLNKSQKKKKNKKRAFHMNPQILVGLNNQVSCSTVCLITWAMLHILYLSAQRVCWFLEMFH